MVVSTPQLKRVEIASSIMMSISTRPIYAQQRFTSGFRLHLYIHVVTPVRPSIRQPKLNLSDDMSVRRGARKALTDRRQAPAQPGL
jgi:hypothetical protein